MKNILFWYGSIQQMSFEVNLQQFHSKQDKKVCLYRMSLSILQKQRQVKCPIT